MLRSLRFRFLAASILLLPATLQADSASDIEWAFDGVARVVAVGDVHGAHAGLLSLLRGTGLIDDKARWIGGRAHFVSVGDLVDRGAESRQVMDLLMRLQQEAQSAGGRVHVVPGNHEIMNITDDLRYVAREEYAAFAPEEDPAERESAFRAYLASLPKPAAQATAPGTTGMQPAPPDEAAARARFANLYPPGYFAHRRAFSLEGRYGRWAAGLPFLIRINDTVFVHGGLPPRTAESSGAALNAQMREELRTYLELSATLVRQGVFKQEDDYDARILAARQKLEAATEAPTETEARADGPVPAVPQAPTEPPLDPELQAALQTYLEFRDSLIFSDQGPLWYRGNAWCHPYWETLRADAALSNLGARRVAVGHTPTEGRRITTRLDGRVVMMDTGMLATYYQGRPAALELSASGARVYYASEDRWAQPEVEQRAVGKRPPGMNDDDIERFLATAEIIESEELSTGVTKPRRMTLSKDGVTLRAVFKTEDTEQSAGTASRADRRLNINDSYKNDIAAYRIDKWLGIDLVPVTIEREIDGDKGALQFWVENSISDLERRQQNVAIYPVCDVQEQYDLMRVFDVLIYNEDRNQTNVLFDRDYGTVRLIDHSRAFRTHRGRPPIYKESRLRVPAGLSERLRALDRKTLYELVGDFLERKQMRSMLKRRDEILKQSELISAWPQAEGTAG